VTAVVVGAADDPLAPVEQDPDALRDAACRLVLPDAQCEPLRPPEPDVDGGGGSSFVGFLTDAVLWLLFVGLVVALVVLAVRLVLSVRGRRRPKRTREAREDDEELEVLTPTIVDRSREPRDWRREADEHRRAGRFRDAIRCRYRALVGDLARRGVVDEIPGRTTGEERAQISAVAPATVPAFYAAADLFDSAWYGGRDVDDATVAEIETLEDRVLQQVSG
jgi:hypothetical protein